MTFSKDDALIYIQSVELLVYLFYLSLPRKQPSEGLHLLPKKLCYSFMLVFWFIHINDTIYITFASIFEFCQFYFYNDVIYEDLTINVCYCDFLSPFIRVNMKYTIILTRLCFDLDVK